MKIIGSKDVFAYQWELLDHGGTFYWGNFCFWINGTQVGYYEELTTLSITLAYLQEFLEEDKNRFYFRSEKVPKDRLYYELRDKLFDDDYKGDQVACFGYLRTVFWLDEIGEDSIRDKIGVILVNEPYEDRQRFIWKHFNTNEIEEAFIPYHFFNGVSKQFMEVLSAEIHSMSNESKNNTP